MESHSLRLEELDKEQAARTRELREQNLELAARIETLKDSLEGEFDRIPIAWEDLIAYLRHYAYLWVG